MSKDGYIGEPSELWRAETKRRIGLHPVLGKSEDLLRWIDEAWCAVWGTKVGDGTLSVPFYELEPRAQIVGDFFESVLALRLSQVGTWRRGSSKEKDLIFTGNDTGESDFEIKTSGQVTGRIYGNRSYAQPGEDGTVDSQSRKKRSGYYLCVNFWEQSIYQVRVGWLDAEDWEPQKSPTGQMAGLKDYVYKFKLLLVPGNYFLSTPIRVLDGLGETTCAELDNACLKTVEDILKAIPNWHIPSKMGTALEAVGVSRRSANRIESALIRNAYLIHAASLYRPPE